MIKNFSQMSLKTLQESVESFKNKYELGLYFNQKQESAKLGQDLHKLIYYYISGFDIKKIENNLDDKKKNIWRKLKESKILDKNFVAVEKSFLVPCTCNGQKFFLNGRFDGVYKEGEKYVITDWKTKNLPKNAQDDLQSIVYLYCASQFFKTENLSIQYIALESLQTETVDFKDEKTYEKLIFDIVGKYLKL